MTDNILQGLRFVYGRNPAGPYYARLREQMATFRAQHPGLAAQPPNGWVTERDSILITYGDMVQQPRQAPLRTLGHFLHEYVAKPISTVHILPFFPYSSDDGFSVIDYRQVDPALGSWDDVAYISGAFRMMFDAVVNHISAHSDWFQGFLRDDPRYRDYFTVVDPAADLSAVFRPRALPLLTQVETTAGTRHVWTTFSDDQIDLNFANPDVLLEVIDTLLFYVSQGAEFIRLDAIAFIWKEIGTDCIHRPQTHRIIQLMRAVLDEVAPHVALITETNVPHADNIAYFGNGRNEAQMVYNFSLPPLTLHAFHTGSAATLSSWARTLTLPSERVTFFNFLASHDGIGVTPARGLLSESAVADMVARVEALGGYVSYRSQPDGTQSAYELNINYLDALGDPAAPHEDDQKRARRFLASQAIMLALRGVPGIYFHSLFGSRGWPEGVAQTGRRRTINRQKLVRSQLDAELARPRSLRRQVFAGYCQMLNARRRHPAFDPYGRQEVLELAPEVFAVWRAPRRSERAVLCLQNVANRDVSVRVPADALPARRLVDLLSGTPHVATAGDLALELSPYQVRWLAAAEDAA